MSYLNKTIIIDNDKNTKLHYAAAFDDCSVLEREIANGQYIDAKNFFGWTPLMVAIGNGSEAAINLLLSKGANSVETNNYGMNILSIAICGKNLRIVKTILNYLLSGGVSRRILQKMISPISLSILFQKTEILDFLLLKGFDPNVATPITGITPLMFAAALENTKAFNKLLAKNVDQDICNALGQTAKDIIDMKIARTRPRPQQPPSALQFAIPPAVQVPMVVPPPQPTPPPPPPPPTPASTLTPATCAAGKWGQSLTPIYLLTPNDGQNQSYPLHVNQLSRTSSNFEYSPSFFCAAGFSPILPPPTPVLSNSTNQMFFPPNFTPSQFSPLPVIYKSNDVLNMAINPMTPYIHSPVFYAQSN